MLVNINNNTQYYEYPFSHWEISNILDAETLKEALTLAANVVPSAAQLKRSEHSARHFITSGNLANKAANTATKQFFSQLINVDLSAVRTRLELCVDLPGFSLEPHVDIPEKLLTLQIYLSGEPNCGTNLYPKTVKFTENLGWLIRNTEDTIHGFDYRPFTKPRVSLILNYVNNDWWDVDQLVRV